jgi:hypothetical protein
MKSLLILLCIIILSSVLITLSSQKEMFFDLKNLAIPFIGYKDAVSKNVYYKEEDENYFKNVFANILDKSSIDPYAPEFVPFAMKMQESSKLLEQLAVVVNKKLVAEELVVQKSEVEESEINDKQGTIKLISNIIVQRPGKMYGVLFQCTSIHLKENDIVHIISASILGYVAEDKIYNLPGMIDDADANIDADADTSYFTYDPYKATTTRIIQNDIYEKIIIDDYMENLKNDRNISSIS